MVAQFAGNVVDPTVAQDDPSLAAQQVGAAQDDQSGAESPPDARLLTLEQQNELLRQQLGQGQQLFGAMQQAWANQERANLQQVIQARQLAWQQMDPQDAAEDRAQFATELAQREIAARDRTIAAMQQHNVQLSIADKERQINEYLRVTYDLTDDDMRRLARITDPQHKEEEARDLQQQRAQQTKRQTNQAARQQVMRRGNVDASASPGQAVTDKPKSLEEFFARKMQEPWTVRPRMGSGERS